MRHARKYLERNGEKKRCESGWTWECSCGETESASTKAECEKEWKNHQSRKAHALVNRLHGDLEIEFGKSLSEEQVKRKIINVWNQPEKYPLSAKIRSKIGLD